MTDLRKAFDNGGRPLKSEVERYLRAGGFPKRVAARLVAAGYAAAFKLEPVESEEQRLLREAGDKLRELENRFRLR